MHLCIHARNLFFLLIRAKHMLCMALHMLHALQNALHATTSLGPLHSHATRASPTSLPASQARSRSSLRAAAPDPLCSCARRHSTSAAASRCAAACFVCAASVAALAAFPPLPPLCCCCWGCAAAACLGSWCSACSTSERTSRSCDSAEPANLQKIDPIHVSSTNVINLWSWEGFLNKHISFDGHPPRAVLDKMHEI
jgi:hypothetical protein